MEKARTVPIAMWLSRMLKDRQEIFVLAELMLFLGAWGFCVAAAINNYHVRSNGNADDNFAANVDLADPEYLDRRGEFE